MYVWEHRLHLEKKIFLCLLFIGLARKGGRLFTFYILHFSDERTNDHD